MSLLLSLILLLNRPLTFVPLDFVLDLFLFEQSEGDDPSGGEGAERTTTDIDQRPDDALEATPCARVFDRPN